MIIQIKKILDSYYAVDTKSKPRCVEDLNVKKNPKKQKHTHKNWALVTAT